MGVKITMGQARPLLVERRIVLMGGGVTSAELSGTTYPADRVVQIQDNVRIEPYVTFWSGSGVSLVTMGAFSYTHSTLSHDVRVGRYTSIARGFRVMGVGHPTHWVSTSPMFYNRQVVMRAYEADMPASPVYRSYQADQREVVIGNDVWIGEDVTVARGVTVGDGAVIGARALVAKDVPPYAVVGGVPAQVLRMRFQQDVVDALLEHRWWRFAPAEVSELDVGNPRDFVAGLEMRIAAGGMRPFVPRVTTKADFLAFGAQE